MSTKLSRRAGKCINDCRTAFRKQVLPTLRKPGPAGVPGAVIWTSRVSGIPSFISTSSSVESEFGMESCISTSNVVGEFGIESICILNWNLCLRWGCGLCAKSRYCICRCWEKKNEQCLCCLWWWCGDEADTQGHSYKYTSWQTKRDLKLVALLIETRKRLYLGRLSSGRKKFLSGVLKRSTSWTKDGVQNCKFKVHSENVAFFSKETSVRCLRVWLGSLLIRLLANP